MAEYVPYEERLRADERKQREAEDASRRERAGAASVAIAALRALQGENTNCYLELLRPTKRRVGGKQTIVTKPGLHGGPHFVIAEVVAAYRIPQAVLYVYNDGSTHEFDAFIAPDGRWWCLSGDGDRDTWQVLASSAREFANLTPLDLKRITAGLKELGRATDDPVPG